nr:hypothetical protein [uncultured Rhodopila sp.]
MQAMSQQKSFPRRLSRDAIGTTVVVRRVWRGANPFRWEIFKAEMAEPVHVSATGFSSMEAAYTAGQAMMTQMLLAQRPAARAPEADDWHGCQIDGMATVL